MIDKEIFRLVQFQRLYAKHYGKELSYEETKKILAAVGGLVLIASEEISENKNN